MMKCLQSDKSEEPERRRFFNMLIDFLRDRCYQPNKRTSGTMVYSISQKEVIRDREAFNNEMRTNLRAELKEKKAEEEKKKAAAARKRSKNAKS